VTAFFFGSPSGNLSNENLPNPTPSNHNGGIGGGIYPN
jgi:hypothetical protein